MEGIDQDTFKRIFHEHWDNFKLVYPRFDTTDYNTAVQKMLDCGDPERMGFVQFRCMACGQIRRIAFTCKSCFCLSCANGYTDHWAEFIGRRLFPGTTYRHMVLTMPDFLHPWFYQHAPLLSQLMRTAYPCLQDILRTSTGLALDIGLIVVLQTFGRSGHFNPHLHILLTAGGLDPKGRWKPVSFIPYEIMHRKWQYHLLQLLRQYVSDPAVQPDIDRAWKNYPKGFVAYLQPGAVPPGGQGLARYLAKYVVSPPIALRRIEQYDGQTVRYWYQDHKTEAVQHETLPVLRFIGRMVQHILPKGFQRIRYYGLHGNVRYAKVRPQLTAQLRRHAPADPAGYRVLPRPSFAQRFLASFGRDPLVCARCGNSMERELISHPKYGIIREYELTVPDEAPAHERSRGRSQLPGVVTAGAALAATPALGQLSLPFL